MTRVQLEEFIKDTYNVRIDYPWLKYPSYEVFRHKKNNKWFALIMDIPKSRLGLEGNEKIDVVNLKCDMFMHSSLMRERGFFPAYHMNKANWITLLLDDTIPDETVKLLVDMSYQLTSIQKSKNN